VYSHYRKISALQDEVGAIAKSNVLLIGSSGTGKTLTCETLARMLSVPFATADATSLAQTKYVNEEIEAMLQRLVDKAGGDVRRAGMGIVFIDEIDKLKATGGESRVTSGESVQHALLKIMEGSPVKLPGDLYRYHQHPVHLRWRFRRTGEDHVPDAWLRFHCHLRSGQQEHPGASQ
jgi:ATP-dependent Clp protease ATP-binding subunit ClpX